MLALLIALPGVQPVSAESGQTPAAPEDFEGFQLLANRFYIHDPEALEEIVTADDASPEAFPPVMALVMVMLFETEEHAEAAFVPYSELMAGTVSGELQHSATPEARETADGDALIFRARDDADGYPVDVTTITMREGDVIYLALAMTANGTSENLSDRLMRFMLEREPGHDEVSFSPGGGSTGGHFALFPTTGDEDLLGGMDIQSDQYLLASSN
jgi:hypothetical protein